MGINALSDPQQLSLRPNHVEDLLGRMQNVFYFRRVHQLRSAIDSIFCVCVMTKNPKLCMTTYDQ